MTDPFWERPEIVARFAARDPDRRLAVLVEGYAEPAAVPVLDAGCAGGRNAVFLAARGFEVHAFDASLPMVEETRRGLEPFVGGAEARRRVRVARMDDLAAWEDGAFELVVSLGLLHNAEDWSEWRRAAAETARVLASGGRLIVAHFTPETDLTGEGVRPVPGETHLYEGLPGGPGILLTPEELDDALAGVGLRPEVPTSTGETILDPGRRVSANGLYRKG